jgi:D-alanyl-D-alanine carboxypeptidase
MVTLALRLQDDFPQHYPLFATRTFTYGGETLYNHNTLLENFEGTDGIKTGYTRASGFNLVASVRRGRKHVVGAIFGGVSTGARNAAMRTFLSLGLVKASSVKTRQPARVAARNIGAVPVPHRVERPGRETASAAAPPTAAPNEARQGPAIEIARVRTVRLAPGPVHPTTTARAATPADLDNAEGARVRAAGDGPPAQAKWTTASAANGPATAPVNAPMYATASGEQPAPASGGVSGGVSGLGATPSTLQAQAVNLARGEPPILTAPPLRVPPVPAAPVPVAAGAFHIQIGAYQSLAEAQKRLATVRDLAPGLLAKRSPVTTQVKQGDKLFYRARFAGFQASAAAGACTELKRLKIDCFVMKAP